VCEVTTRRVSRVGGSPGARSSDSLICLGFPVWWHRKTQTYMIFAASKVPLNVILRDKWGKTVRFEWHADASAK
jgi:hypothetical protein